MPASNERALSRWFPSWDRERESAPAHPATCRRPRRRAALWLRLSANPRRADEAPETPRPPIAPVVPTDKRSKERTAATDQVRQLRRRDRIRWVLFALLPLALIVGGYWYVTGGQVMSTDDAYVNAQKVGISTDVSGIVQDVAVKENDHVAAGQVLYRLDPRQFQIALDNAKANLAQIALMIESMKQDYKRMISDAAAQQAQVDLDQTNYDRAAHAVEKRHGDASRLRSSHVHAAKRQEQARSPARAGRRCNSPSSAAIRTSRHATSAILCRRRRKSTRRSASWITPSSRRRSPALSPTCRRSHLENISPRRRRPSFSSTPITSGSTRHRRKPS